MNNREALRSEPARNERRTSMVLASALLLAMSAAEPLYRPFDGALFAVRVVLCIVWLGVGLSLPRATSRVYGVLLPLAAASGCWLFATTVWLNGGVASPDFQYMVLLPLALMVIFQDEVVACAAGVVGTVSAV